MRKAQSTPGMSTANYYQSVIHATWLNNKKKPFDDPRVRRAMHLALDRPVLVEVVKDVAPMWSGSFIYPFSEFATPTRTGETARLPGRSRCRDQRGPALLAAAGYPNGIKGLDFMVRDIAIFKLWSQAIQAMLKEALNVECNLRTVVEVRYGSTMRKRAISTWRSAPSSSTLLDPSDYFSAWYGKDGPQNYSVWDNEEFQALLPQIDREVDPAKRQALVRQAEAIMEQDPPLLPGLLGEDQRCLVQLRQGP